MSLWFETCGQCCGVCEISGIGENSPKMILRSAADGLYSDEYQGRFRFMVFTGSTENDSLKTAAALKAFILKNKLGEVIKTKKRENPNTTNIIQMYVWTINHNTFRRWARKQGTDVVFRTEGGANENDLEKSGQSRYEQYRGW